MNFEILAPAGSMESLIAGVRSGANAVYLGGKLFNARRSAGNFDDEELKKALEYCRQRGVKVYLTLNILLSDRELPEVYQTVKTALEYGVDAFIVQDIGTAKMIKTHFPNARLHASTQMTLLTPSAVKGAISMGFKRVVLPREMTLDEIKEIENSTSAELEIFVHGAHCMSVSGQCYLSSMIGARSGNRGLCAQPCRLPFTAGGDVKYALSLKDLSLINDLALLDGITSLKIEGRMKRPEYVSAAVTAVKKAVNGEYKKDDEKLLRSVFSRSGFTDGYIKGEIGGNMFGVRSREDVVSASNKVLSEIGKNYAKENPLLPIDMHFRCKAGEPCKLTAYALGKRVKVSGAVPEKAIDKPLTSAAVEARLSKLGGTQFYANDIKADIDSGLILSASEINDMRRRAVAEINKIEPLEVTAKPLDLPSLYRTVQKGIKTSEPYATAAFSNVNQIPEHHNFKRIFIPISSDNKAFTDISVGAVLPRGAFGCENKIKSRLNELKKIGVENILCPDLGGYHLAKELGFKTFGDFTLNIFNSVSASMIDSPILSPELNLAQANSIKANDTGLIVYGFLPLMLMRNCPVKNDIGCKNCKKHSSLTDRTGRKFPIVCSSYPCVEMLNSIPLYMLDRIDEIKTDFVHFCFSTESREQVEKIISMYENKSKPDFEYTRGLYQRGAL